MIPRDLALRAAEIIEEWGAYMAHVHRHPRKGWAYEGAEADHDEMVAIAAELRRDAGE